MASFFTASLCLLKLARVVSNFPISNFSTLIFKLLNLIGAFLIFQYLIYLHQILNRLSQSFNKI